MPNPNTRTGFTQAAAIMCLAAIPGFLASTAKASSRTEDALHEAWRTAIVHTAVPQRGCFEATYPLKSWTQVACVAAPDKPFLPRDGRGSFTVGDGDDYTAQVTGLISSGEGSFPTITGLKSESGDGAANQYTLQMNSQFFASPRCSGAKDPAKCLGWEQFVYYTGGVTFMQYWLINYAAKCPSGWMAYSSDCYTNSNGVNTPAFKAKKLHTLKLSGSAVANGIDTVTLSTPTKAYSVTGEDSVVTLASYWNAAEYNVFGPGGGSEASFNKGTSITVLIALTDGLSAAPTCVPDSGTTGETNNLNLGACTTSGGATPSVMFTETD
jgi:hypothetical protein